MAESKSVPTGVKILAVLNYIGAAFLALFAIMLFLGGSAIASQIPGLALLGTGVFVIGGLVLLAIAVFSFFIGRGLWKAKKWARIVSIILSAFGMVFSIMALIGEKTMSGVIYLVMYAAIGGYLLFNKKVKQAFA